MSTLRDQIHELGNKYNNLSLGTIVTREELADTDPQALSPEQLAQVFQGARRNFARFEKFICDANMIINAVGNFIQKNHALDLFTSLKDCHSRISQAIDGCQRALAEHNISAMIAALEKIEVYVAASDKALEAIKPEIYKKVGREAQID